MADDKYNYARETEFSALAPARRSYDVTPSADDLPEVTRAIMVSEDGVTVTGILVGDDEAESHTTFGLKAGIMYPMMWQKITAVSTGSVKAYY